MSKLPPRGRVRAFARGMRRAVLAVAITGCMLAVSQAQAAPVSTGVQAVDVTASTPAARKRAAARASLPAANFLVEWRIEPVAATSSRGDVVITSNSATAGGATGYGPGSVVVGTARAQVPQAVRVANGHDGEMRFDKSETRTVYDMSYASASSSESSTAASGQAASGATGSGASKSRSKSRERGVEGHEVVVHRVDGLRVTPRWTRGDNLELDVQLTHGAPTAGSGLSGADSSATREFSFTSTVQVSFDEWQSVANVGDGGEELQVRVTWR